MRVLWFTNTPSLSADYLNHRSVGGGWIGSLEAALSEIPNIELGISFNVADSNIKTFRLNKTRYFPVCITAPKSKMEKLVFNWTKPILNEKDIQPYLDVINTFKPDIINIFGTEGAFGLIISKTKIPCVIHLQGNLIICNQKWYSGLSSMNVLRYSRKSSLLKGSGTFHNYFISKKSAARERKIFPQCKYFMGRTDWDRRISSVLSPKSKYLHCDEIMRPDFYSHEWVPPINKTNYTIISTIRDNIYKGLETVLESIRILNNIGLKEQISWEIAGISETDELVYLIERKYQTKFREHGIQLLGPLQEKELITKMLQANVFIHPSHIDNSPNSVCEAMLMGMPVIATFAGGIPSLITNKRNGLLVQDGDPYSLAGAIIEMKENYNRSISFGKEARREALVRHDKNKIVNDLVNIYQTILEDTKQKQTLKVSL